MKPDEFARGLNILEFVFSEKDKAEVLKEFLQDVENSFRVSQKKKQNSEFDNPLLSFIQKYDCSRLEIGLITFNENIEEDVRYYYIGKHEADELALNKQTGEVELREYGLDHTICYCAENGEKFLDALLVFAESVAKSPFEQ